MIAIGLGCRNGIDKNAVIALIVEAVAQAGTQESGETVLFTHERKASEAGLQQAANELRLPLRALPAQVLTNVDAKAFATHSSHSVRATGLPSLCEAAALAGAGPGARLIVPRIIGPGVACAIAQSKQS